MKKNQVNGNTNMAICNYKWLFLCMAGPDVIGDIPLINHRWPYKNREKFPIGNLVIKYLLSISLQSLQVKY